LLFSLKRELEQIWYSSLELWYLLTNIGTLKQAVTAFKCRSGIEAMFKDGKTGGYNFEKSCGCFEHGSYYTLFSALWLYPWLGLLPF
jgi:hypothetical protein